MSTQLQLEELHRQASSDYLRGDFAAAMEAWSKVLEIEPGDERAEEGIRLCKHLVPEANPGEAQPHQASPEAIDADAPLEFDLLSEDPPDEQEKSSAASELKRRVDALLASAREQSEAGQSEAALRTLGRLLILDDENEQAREMQARLRAGEDAASIPEPSVGDVCDTLILGAPGETAPAAPSPQSEAPSADAGEEPELNLSLESEPEPEVDVERLLGAMPATPELDIEEPPSAGGKSGGKFALPPWLGDRRAQYGLGGVLLLLLVFAGMHFMGGDEAPPVNEPLPVRTAGKQEPKPVADGAPAAAEGAPAQPATPADPSELIAQGEAAFAEQDYAAAVIAFGKVLEQFPDEAAVRARLDSAAELYREQGQKQLRWEEAVAAFETQNYGQALRLFYRMDQADYEADLERVKINGWYNHGVNALRMNRCEEAWDHFSEARALDATDEAILDGLEYAGDCDASAIQVAIRSTLTFRGLED